jgi:hypothetical protein
MSLADRYRAFAAECERVARQARDPKDSALLMEMAETWRRLAEAAKPSNHQKSD